MIVFDAGDLSGQPAHDRGKHLKFVPVKMQRNGSIGEVQPAAAARVQRRLSVAMMNDIVHDCVSLVLVMYSSIVGIPLVQRNEARL
jgi:hypothetical protein